MVSEKKVISILNMEGNSYVLFTFINLMYVMGKYSEKTGKKVLFIDFDLLKAEFSRNFNIPNSSKFLTVIETFKKEMVVDKEAILNLIIKDPELKSGVVMKNVDGFFITGNIAKIISFLKFDIEFLKSLLKILKEEYDLIYIFTSEEGDSKANKYFYKTSDKIISTIVNLPHVFENTVHLVEEYNVNEEKLSIFFYMMQKNKNFFESVIDKIIPIKKINEDDFLDKLSYFLFKRTLTEEEKNKLFIHLKLNEGIIAADAAKDTVFNGNEYMNEDTRKAYLNYLMEYISDMFA